MDFYENLRSLGSLGGQRAPRAADGVGIKLLYRCQSCQRIWLQDGRQITLELEAPQIQALARELSADLDRLPASTCRLCLYRAGGGAVEVDEYGQGQGFGFNWECPHPSPVHALLTVLSRDWLRQLPDQASSLPDIVTHPERMRAILAWFRELLPPRQYCPLDRTILQEFNQTNRPGFGQPHTEHWRWQGCSFETFCPPLGRRASLLLLMAMPTTERFHLPALFPVWQSLAFLTLLGSVPGERPPEASDHQAPPPH